ncbi:ATP-dependent RNA helicase DHX8 [Cordyceps fumosorosea ARSEF 2679]|uniref:ATP-dependent RNA helicase DHX8 n=1 Tax=Cordyceps fumosorosea (strain ARSEF 2679) TaxID=1081104 RepID=A0A168DBJ3_CORFA|nr:ATP-dependent RNA helicase DHX8 [Cordyceps fumosorosea ARSEF 2679]OAA72401.1 ATP-dependent RNA helicase DHX8 [Cordyceps fumosorosea ARSEF 2679]
MSEAAPTIPSTTAVPYRQIRALYDEETITVYQAYSPAIAIAAVAAQRLDASPDFRPGRMTWVKPSWAWIMYRAGYSYKDARQARILALRMKHADFLALLQRGVLSHGGAGADANAGPARDRAAEVRVQWDPERDPALRRLPYRSIQIGIPGTLSTLWAREWIVSIEDVTETARSLKRALDEDPDLSLQVLVERGLVPQERPFQVPDTIMTRLDMTRPGQIP